MDHTTLALEFLGEPAAKPAEAPAPAAKKAAKKAEETGPWTEVATRISTALGAAAFHRLKESRELDIDVEVEEAVDTALAEVETGIPSDIASDIASEIEASSEIEAFDIEIDVEDANRPNTQDAIEGMDFDLLLLEPPEGWQAPELSIDIDFVTDDERLRLEASIAQQSESLFWEGLDGEQGVFLATYQELPIGTQVELTVHLVGGESFVAPAVVRWVRQEHTGVWPGLGLELEQVTEQTASLIARFARFRPSLFISA